MARAALSPDDGDQLVPHVEERSDENQVRQFSGGTQEPGSKMRLSGSHTTATRTPLRWLRVSFVIDEISPVWSTTGRSLHSRPSRPVNEMSTMRVLEEERGAGGARAPCAAKIQLQHTTNLKASGSRAQAALLLACAPRDKSEEEEPRS